MTTQLLRAGAQFDLCGSEFEVAGIGQDAIRISPIRGGLMRTLQIKALDDLVKGEQIKLLFAPPCGPDVEGKPQLSGLDDQQLKAFNRRLAYVRGVYSACPDTPCAQRVIEPEIAKIAKDRKDPHTPGASTVADWIKKWIRGGRTDAALMPRLKPSRANLGKLDKTVVQFLMEAVDEVYLTRARNSVKAIRPAVEIRIANHNATSPDKLVTPSVETIRQFVNRIDLYERDCRRHGKAYARRKHRAAGTSFVAREPLELCMADGQILDCIVIEERDDGQPPEEIGRPFLTSIIDVRTRVVPSAYVSLSPFCGATLLKAMAQAVTAEPGKPRGVMSRLIIDNGSDYRDGGFLRFCEQLDIQVEPCAPRMPNGKAIKERFFRTLNDDCIHRLPGSTFSNPTDRGDYDSQGMARVTIDFLRAHIQAWIDHKYHVTPHRSLGRAPIDVWNEEVRA